MWPSPIQTKWNRTPPRSAIIRGPLAFRIQELGPSFPGKHLVQTGEETERRGIVFSLQPCAGPGSGPGELLSQACTFPFSNGQQAPVVLRFREPCQQAPGLVELSFQLARRIGGVFLAGSVEQGIAGPLGNSQGEGVAKDPALRLLEESLGDPFQPLRNGLAEKEDSKPGAIGKPHRRSGVEKFRPERVHLRARLQRLQPVKQHDRGVRELRHPCAELVAQRVGVLPDVEREQVDTAIPDRRGHLGGGIRRQAAETGISRLFHPGRLRESRLAGIGVPGRDGKTTGREPGFTDRLAHREIGRAVAETQLDELCRLQASHQPHREAEMGRRGCFGQDVREVYLGAQEIHRVRCLPRVRLSDAAPNQPFQQAAVWLLMHPPCAGDDGHLASLPHPFRTKRIVFSSCRASLCALVQTVDRFGARFGASEIRAALPAEIYRRRVHVTSLSKGS